MDEVLKQHEKTIKGLIDQHNENMEQQKKTFQDILTKQFQSHRYCRLLNASPGHMPDIGTYSVVSHFIPVLPMYWIQSEEEICAGYKYEIVNNLTITLEDI